MRRMRLFLVFLAMLVVLAVSALPAMARGGSDDFGGYDDNGSMSSYDDSCSWYWSDYWGEWTEWC